MFLTIRTELHEKYLGEKIPASDFQIEAEEFEKIGLLKKWTQNTDHAEKKMPPAFYIGENINSALVRPTLNAIRRRTGRKVSATFQESPAVYFDDLEDATPHLNNLWEAVAKLPPSLSKIESNTSSYRSLLGGFDSTENKKWVLAALGAAFDESK